MGKKINIEKLTKKLNREPTAAEIENATALNKARKKAAAEAAAALAPKAPMVPVAATPAQKPGKRAAAAAPAAAPAAAKKPRAANKPKALPQKESPEYRELSAPCPPGPPGPPGPSAPPHPPCPLALYLAVAALMATIEQMEKAAKLPKVYIVGNTCPTAILSMAAVLAMLHSSWWLSCHGHVLAMAVEPRCSPRRCARPRSPPPPPSCRTGTCSNRSVSGTYGARPLRLTSLWYYLLYY